MRLRRFIPLVLVFLALGALWAQAAYADEAAVIYNPGTVVFIDLTLSSEAEAKLEEKPDKYVKGTFSMTKSSDGTPAGEEPAPVRPPRPVEVRLKGSVGGSFRKLSKKAAFKLKFKEADAFFGLRKMTLNNMVQDRSMVHETLAYSAFRAAGVPASRTGYAYVRVNGNDFGLYLDLENLDNIALARIFDSFDSKTQHLYEGEDGHDVTPGEAPEFEIDEGEKDRTDLETLIEAVNGEGDEPWSKRVALDADLTEMTKMWAVEKYIDHWDGYSGHAIPNFRPNNYYLYSDPTGRFQMLPWGTDQTWIPTIGVGTPGREVTFDGPGGVLFNKCLEDPRCWLSYWESLNDVKKTIAVLDPGALASDTADLLAPWQKEERELGRPEFDAAETEDGVEETLDFIAGRQAEAEAWLAENEPPAKAGAPSVSARSGLSANVISIPDVVPGRFAVTNGVLISRVWVSGAGAVRQRVSISTRRGRLRVCATDEKARQAGPVILRCRLSNVARRRLRDRSLRLKAYTTFVPLGRAGTVTVHNLKAPRDPSL